MALVELIATPTTQPEILDQLETFVTSAARQGRRARQGHAELHRQPRRHRRHAGDDEGGRDLRPRLRRGRRPDRQEARPRQQRHLPHRRRGGPGHDGARHQDAAGQPGRRSVLPELRHAAGAGRADRQGRARPEERRRLLQKVGKDILRLDPAKADYVPGRRQGRRDRRPHAEEAAGRAAEAAARVEQPAGAVPVGDPARQLPLRGGAPGRHRRLARATSTSRCAGASACSQGPFELWQLAGWKQVAEWVKADIDAGKALSQGAAARLGVRRPPRSGVHTPEGSWSPKQGKYVAAQQPAGLPAPALPRERGRLGRRRRR